MVPPGVVALLSVAEAVAGDGAVPVLHCPVQEELAGAHRHHLVDPEKCAVNIHVVAFSSRCEGIRVYRSGVQTSVVDRIRIRILKKNSVSGSASKGDADPDPHKPFRVNKLMFCKI